MKLSEFLQRYLQEQGISGRELARRCDLAPQTIFNILRGSNKDGTPLRLDTKTLAKIANGLGYYGAKFATVNGVTLISIPDVTDIPEDTPVFQPETNLDNMTDYLEEIRRRPEIRMLLDVSKGATKENIEAIVKLMESIKG